MQRDDGTDCMGNPPPSSDTVEHIHCSSADDFNSRVGKR